MIVSGRVSPCGECRRPTVLRSLGRPFCSPRCRDARAAGRPLVVPAVVLRPLLVGEPPEVEPVGPRAPLRLSRSTGPSGAARITAVVEGLRADPGVWRVVIENTSSKSAAKPYTRRGCEIRSRGLGGGRYEVSARWPFPPELRGVCRDCGGRAAHPEPGGEPRRCRRCWAALHAVVDEVAVERLMAGDRPSRASAADKREAVARLSALGLSAAEIGQRMGVAARVVVRYRSGVAA